jgi:putative colanic acid biosynthesis acetyltransferase WcaF
VRYERGILPGAKFGTPGRERSFSWSNLLFRAVWNVAWLVLAAWTPPQLYGWRRRILNLFGARVATSARVYPSVRIWYPPNLVMGEGSVLGPGTFCYCMDRIVLEDYAEVAQFVQLITGTHDIDSERFQLVTRPIRVCSHAWLAMGSFVGPGVVVGEGAVLGGRSVTFRDLQPWTVYSGNPAAELRKRQKFA